MRPFGIHVAVVGEAMRSLGRRVLVEPAQGRRTVARDEEGWDIMDAMVRAMSPVEVCSRPMRALPLSHVDVRPGLGRAAIGWTHSRSS
jgi:hypothetical protein